MRHSEDEPAAAVLARLKKNEPRWEPHHRSPENPRALKHPDGPLEAAMGRDIYNEAYESFQARHAAWKEAVAREEKRKAEEAK